MRQRADQPAGRWQQKISEVLRQLIQLTEQEVTVLRQGLDNRLPEIIEGQQELAAQMERLELERQAFFSLERREDLVSVEIAELVARWRGLRETADLMLRQGLSYWQSLLSAVGGPGVGVYGSSGQWAGGQKQANLDRTV